MMRGPTISVLNILDYIGDTVFSYNYLAKIKTLSPLSFFKFIILCIVI